jgi:hypothetical protein
MRNENPPILQSSKAGFSISVFAWVLALDFSPAVELAQLATCQNSGAVTWCLADVKSRAVEGSFTHQNFWFWGQETLGENPRF